MGEARMARSDRPGQRAGAVLGRTLLLMLVAVQGCGEWPGGPGAGERRQEGGAVSAEAAEAKRQIDTPPIDLAAPARTETATFALG